MKTKQLDILLLAYTAVAITVLATSCEKSLSNVSNAPTPQPSISPTGNKITISAKAKQIEAKMLRGELVNEVELAGLPPVELRILRNVVFARHGLQYERPGLGDYFYYCDWYKPDPSTGVPTTNWKKILTANDEKNRDVIKHKEAKQTPPPAPTSTVYKSGRCPTDVNLSLCYAIAAQGIEKIVKGEGLLENCSMEQASEIMRKCIELKKRYSP